VRVIWQLQSNSMCAFRAVALPVLNALSLHNILYIIVFSFACVRKRVLLFVGFIFSKTENQMASIRIFIYMKLYERAYR